MNEKHAFTIEQLHQFRQLSNRLRHLKMSKQEMADQIAKLEREQRQADEEAAEMEERLNGEFAELAEVADLFSTAQAVPDTILPLEETNYVTRDKKELLLVNMMRAYKRANPDANTITYTEVKKTLAETYKIKTRSIANFFLGILSDYQTVGGNRNKAIVIPKDY